MLLLLLLLLLLFSISLCIASAANEEFDDLCFRFGIEVDDIQVEPDNEVTFRIEVGANRCARRDRVKGSRAVPQMNMDGYPFLRGTKRAAPNGMRRSSDPSRSNGRSRCAHTISHAHTLSHTASLLRRFYSSLLYA
eukprot:GHVU01233017.1.p1 GENE.GHVU01233017.1~~GHVU01233017.1.p1  ORF type:complete len:136 (+),score=14.80 GHVU01233017.1:2695-3102(+)